MQIQETPAECERIALDARGNFNDISGGAYRGLCPAHQAPRRYPRQLATAARARGQSIPRSYGADFPPPRSPAADQTLSVSWVGPPPVARWQAAAAFGGHGS